MLRERGGDLNMRSAALHMGGDALGSLAVLSAGAVLVADPSLRWADPTASLVVAVIIVVEAYRLLRASVDVLLESSPADVDLAELTAVMGRVPGVAEVHDLHVWSLSSDVRALSAHVVLSGHPTLEEAQVVGDKVKSAIGDAVHDRPQHAGARVRAVHRRRGRPVPDGQRGDSRGASSR